ARRADRVGSARTTARLRLIPRRLQPRAAARSAGPKAAGDGVPTVAMQLSAAAGARRASAVVPQRCRRRARLHSLARPPDPHLARARARNRRAVASRTRTLGNQLRTDRARQHRRRTPRPRTHPTAQTTTSGLDREALARSGSVKDVSALIRKGCFRLRNPATYGCCKRTAKPHGQICPPCVCPESCNPTPCLAASCIARG